MSLEDIQHSHSAESEFEDAAVRRIRLIRIGVRNKDRVTLDTVRDDLIQTFGEEVGSRVYDDLLFNEISEVNKQDMRKKYGIDLQ